MVVLVSACEAPVARFVAPSNSNAIKTSKALGRAVLPDVGQICRFLKGILLIDTCATTLNAKIAAMSAVSILDTELQQVEIDCDPPNDNGRHHDKDDPESWKPAHGRAPRPLRMKQSGSDKARKHNKATQLQ